MKIRFAIARIVVLLCVLLISLKQTFAEVQTVKSGSFIINMGITPQTTANALKPYGMIYDLIQNYGVPIKWVINPAKTKDGLDFIHNGVAYRGGTFVIPATYRTSAVNSRITYWQGQGVVGASSVGDFSIDVTYTLYTAPRFAMDAQNGSITISYLTAAGFPASSYYYKTPAQLNNCDDVYSMPHADPTWATHSNLYNFNKNYKGSIYAGCHSASAMESYMCTNPSNPAENMNFLTTGGLVLWKLHSGGSAPYQYANFTHPVFQFMGIADAAHLNGSEQIYLPVKSTSTWRPGVSLGIFDSTQVNIPATSDGPGAISVVGRGFGNSNSGWVFYQSGHTVLGTGTANIAAMRQYFNFNFLAARDKAPEITYTNLPTTLLGLGVYNNLTVNIGNLLNGPYTYQWSATIPGVFSNPTGAVTNFTPSGVSIATSGEIYCRVSDGCGRTVINPMIITVQPGGAPPVAVADSIHISVSCGIGQAGSVNVLNNDYDVNNNLVRTISFISNGSNGTFVHSGSGLVTYTPNANFTGVDQAVYQVCDDGPLCVNGTIRAFVGTADGNGCFPNSYFGTSAIEGTTDLVSGENSIGTSANALDVPDDLVSTFNAANDSLILRLETNVRASDTLFLSWFKTSGGGTATINVSTSPDNITYSTPTALSTTSTTVIQSNYIIPVSPAGGARYIKIKTSTNNVSFDGLTYNAETCLSRVPVVGNDNFTALEDSVLIMSVISNDQDPGGNTMYVSRIVSYPAKGYVGINPNNTISYITMNDSSGTDNFTYEACNSLGYCATATVNISIPDDGCSAGQYRPISGGPQQNTTIIAEADNEIRQDNATTVYNSTTLDFGKNGTAKRRALLRFNVSAIPAGAIIDSATLFLTRTGGDKTSQVVNIYALTAGFTETEATWNRRSTANAWTTAGADFNSLLQGSATMLKTNNITTAIKGMGNVVGGWVANSSTNYGFIVRTDESLNKRHTLASRTHATTAYRPALQVWYRELLPCKTTPRRPTIADQDYVTTVSGTSVSVSPLSNDHDADIGSVLSLVGVIGTPSNGTHTINGSTILYTPASNFIGRDTIKYIVTDTDGLRDTAQIVIKVNNSGPQTKPDSATIAIGNSALVSVKSNDLHPASDTMSLPAVVVNPLHGYVTSEGNALRYTPVSGFYGVDSFWYSLGEAAIDPCNGVVREDTAWVKIVVTNTAPTANNDTYTAPQCNVMQFNVIANDTDPENGSLTITQVGSAQKGTVSIVNNQLVYASSSGQTGADQFTYTICDNGAPALCSSATVNVNISAVAPPNTNPVAVNDVIETEINTTAFISVLDNDSDPENNQFSTDSVFTGLLAPTLGSITVEPNGQITYVPNAGVSGVDYFQYRICELTPLYGSGCVTLTQLCDTATIKVTISNRPPAANDDAYATTSTSVISANIGNNDYEPDGQPMTFSMISGPSHGNMVINSNGTFTYTPDGAYTGTVSITYKVCDNGVPSLCDTAVVVITIGVGNMPPIPMPDYNNTLVNNPVSGTVDGNDTDPNGNLNTTSFTVTIQPNNGSVLMAADGSYTYTPDSSFTGYDYFTYSVCDLGGLCATAQVEVLVRPFVYVIPASPSVCYGTGTTLTAYGGANYIWSPPTGLSKTSGNVVIANPINTTTYTVVGTDLYGMSNSMTVVVAVLPLPVMQPIIGGATLCAGSGLNLSAGPAGGVWSSSNTNAITVDSSTGILTGLTQGTSTVTYTYADNNGCVNTSTAVVNSYSVSGSATVSNATYPGSTDGSVNLTVSGGLPGYTYQWSNGATTEDLTGVAEGTYEVIVTDLAGCKDTVTVNVQSNYQLLSNNVIAASQTVLSGNVPSGFSGNLPTGGTGTYSYQWERSTNNGSSWSSVSGATGQNFAESGVSVYSEYRRIVSDGVVPASTSNVISVTPLNYSITASNNGPVYVGSTLNLSASPSNPGGTYSWAGPNGYTATGQYPSITNAQLSAGGIYTVTQSIDNITVSATTTPAVYPLLSNTISASQTVLSGNSPSTFNGNLPTGGTGVYTYQWEYTTDGSTWNIIAGATSQNYSEGPVSNFTEYRRIVTSGALPPVVSNSISVTPVSYSITASNNGPVYVGSTLNLSASPSNPGGTYSWSGPNGYTATGQYPTITNAQLSAGGVYTVTQSIDNITVTATTTPAVYPLLSNTITASQTVLSGNSPSTFNGNLPTGGTGVYAYQWEYTTDGSTWNIIAGATSQNYNEGSVSNFTEYRRIVTSGALPPVVSNSISVTPVSYSITASNNGPVYVGSTLNLSASPSNPGGTYSWSGPNGYTATGQYPTITNAQLSAGGVYTVTQSVDNITLTATTTPVVLPVLGPNTITTSQTVLSGNSPAAFTGSVMTGGTGSYTFQWEESTDNGSTWTTITGGTNQNYPDGPVSVYTEYRRIVTDGSMPPSTSNVISVTPVSYSITASNNGPVYVGSTLNLSASPSNPGGTYSWSGPNGYTATGQYPTITNAQLSAGGVYTVTQSIDNITVSATTTPVVLPVLGPNVITTSQTVLSGNSPATFTGSVMTGGTGSYTFQWEESTDNGSTWTTITGGTNQNYPDGPVSVYTEYRRIVTDGSMPPSTSNVISVTPVSYSITASNNGPVYVGSTLNLSASPSNPGGTYSWSGPNGYTATGQYPSITNAQLSAGGVYTVTQSIDNITISATTTPVVLPVLGPNVITTSQTVLSGNSPATFTGSVMTGGTGSYTFQWEESTDNGSTWTTITGGTNQNYPDGPVSVYTEYRRIVTDGSMPPSTSNVISVTPVSYSITASNNGPVYVGSTLNLSASPSNPGGTYSWSGPNGYTATGQYPTITNAQLSAGGVYTVTQSIDNITISATTTPVVLPVLGPNVITTSQTVLSGNSPATFTGSVMTGGTGSYTFQWEESTDNGSTWTTITGGTNQNYPDGPVSVYTEYRRIVTDGSMPPSTSNVISVTPVSYSITASNNGPVYVGSTLNLSASPSNPGGTYSWSGPNGYTATGQYPTITNAQLSAGGVYTVTQSIDNITVSATTTPVVLPVLGPNVITTSQTVLSGTSPATFTGSVMTGGTGSYTFQWEESTDNGSTWTTITGGTNQNYPDGPVSVYTEYRRIVTDGSMPPSTSNVISVTPVSYSITASNNGPVYVGSTLNLSASPSNPGGTYSWSGPNGYTATGQYPTITNAQLSAGGVYTVTQSIDNITISATTTPVVLPVLGPNVITTSQTVLSGNSPATFTGSVMTGGTGSYTFQWEESTDNGSTWTTITGGTNQNYPDGPVSVYTEYRRIVTDGSMPPSTSNVISVTPLSYTLTIASNTPVCTGSTISLTASSDIPGAQYVWTGPNGFTGSGAVQNISNAVVANSGNYTVSVSVNTLTLSSTEYVDILDPFTGLTSGSNSPICQGQTLHLSASTLPGVSYSWTGPNGFTSALASPSVTGALYTNTGNYTLHLSHSTCTTADVVLPVVVNVASLSPTSNSPVCEGSNIGLSAFPNVGATYNWSGPGAFAQTGNVISRNPALATYAGYYRVTGNVPGCGSGIVDSVLIIVGRHIGDVTASTNAPVCANSTLALNATSVVGAGYFWQGPNSFTSLNTNVNRASIARQDSGIYTLTITSPGCESKVVQLLAAVNDPALLVAQNNSPVCIGGTFNLSASCPLASSFTWVGPMGYSSNAQFNTLTNGVIGNTGMYSVYANIPGCGVVYTPTSVAVNEPATVLNVTSDTTLCSGQILNLSVTPYQNAEYMWTGPAGRTSISQSPVFSRVNSTHAGVYSVTVSVPACGSNSAVSRPLSITDIPGLNAYSNSPICDLDYMYLDCASIFGATYRWTGPNGYTSSRQGPGEEAVSFSYTGQYTVTANVPGCGAVYDVVDVVVYPAIRSVTAGSNSPICQGGNIILTSLYVPFATYSWAGPNGFTANSGNVNIGSATVQHSGIYTLTITSPACPIHYCYVNVIVGQSQLLPLTTTSPVCAGNLLVLSAPWVPNTTYTWTAPNGSTYNSPDITVAYARLQDAGTYSLTTNFIGCGTVTNAISVVVNFPNHREISVWTNSPACAGGDLMLSVPYNTSGAYSWRGPNGFTSNSNAPVIPFVNSSHAGEYSLSINVPGCGIANYLARTVVNRLPVLTASSNSPVCEGNSVYLYCGSDIPFTSSRWDGPNGFSSNQKEPGFHNATSLSAGVYTIVSNIPGCGQSFSTVNVSVSPAITTVTVNSNTPLCTGQTLIMTSSSAGGATYLWQGPGGFTSSSKDFTISNVTSAQTGTYTLTISQGGCGVRQLTHYVNVFNVVPPVATSAKAIYCSGENVYLNCTSVVGATQYRWTGPNSYTYNGMYGSISNAAVSRSGQYSVTVTHPACGTLTSAVNVIVNPMVNNYSLTSNTPVCLGGTLNLSSNIPLGGTVTQVWAAPNGQTFATNTTTIPGVTFSEAGNYVYTVTSPGCGTSTRSLRIAVNDPSTVTASVNTPLCRGQVAYFSGAGTPGTTYAWVGPVSYTSAAQWASRSNVQLTHAGQYTLNATVPGCGVVSRTVDLVVNTCRIAGEDSGDDGLDGNQEVVEVAAQDELPDENKAVLENFTVYPNPFSDEVNCTWSDMKVFSIKIFDLNGKLLQEVEPGEATAYQIHTGNLPSGVYMMTVLTSAGPKNIRVTRL